jgi:hypothetical protein
MPCYYSFVIFTQPEETAANHLRSSSSRESFANGLDCVDSDENRLNAIDILRSSWLATSSTMGPCAHEGLVTSKTCLALEHHLTKHNRIALNDSFRVGLVSFPPGITQSLEDMTVRSSTAAAPRPTRANLIRFIDEALDILDEPLW